MVLSYPRRTEEPTSGATTGSWPLREENRKSQIAQLRRALAEFGELALRSDNLDEILSEACRLVAEALSIDLVKVVQFQEDRKTLKVRAGVGWRPGIVGVQTTELAEDTPEGVALRTGRPMVSPDIRMETRFKCPPFIIDHGARAVANVVIVCDSEKESAFGVLEANSRLPREFTDQDLAFLRSYGRLIEAAVIRTMNTKIHDLAETDARLRRETDERVRVEEALHQSQKLAAVGQLTGGLSHDLNNILTAISGDLELLSRRVAQGRIAELNRHIEASMFAVNRAVALTQRLLAFSRRQTLKPKVVDLNQIIRGMQDLICRTLGPYIQTELRLTEGSSLILCDPNQVESALLNLAINARDAMPGGGHLTFETTNIALPIRDEISGKRLGMNLPSGNYVGLSVIDTGRGMSSSVLENALNPFFTTKPVGQGTGLGLSIIDSFVRQSGGEVQLQSQATRGTTVKILFPRHLEAIRHETDASVAPSQDRVACVQAARLH
jgi:signal transduction histidine kinase